MKNIGHIYIIENKVNGKLYVGSSINPKQRWRQHRFQLKRGTHHCRHLQNAWTKYGSSEFTFLVVERDVDLLFLSAREQFTMWRYEVNCYNQSLHVDQPSYGYKHSTETRRLMSLTRKGVGGREWSDEDRERHGRVLRGRKMPPVSDSTRANISSAKRGWTPDAAIVASAVARRKRIVDAIKPYLEQGLSYRAIERITGHCRETIGRIAKVGNISF